MRIGFVYVWILIFLEFIVIFDNISINRRWFILKGVYMRKDMILKVIVVRFYGYMWGNEWLF